MRIKFVKTENVLRLVGALQELEAHSRAHPGRSIGIIEGRTGTGKTWATEWYCVQNRQAVFVRSLKRWTATWMIEDISLALGLEAPGTMRKAFRMLRDELYRSPRTLIIDEADRVIRREDLLETVRDLHDLTGAPVVLVSEGGAKEMVVRKSPRTWRRITQTVDFAPLTVADVQVLAEELADLRLEKRTAERVHEQSLGGFGETMNLLEKLEAVVKANPGAGVSDRVVDMALRARGGKS